MDNGITETIGALGNSSAGHVVELVGMRPSDTRYNVSPFGKPHFGLATQPAMSIMSAFPLCDPPGSWLISATQIVNRLQSHSSNFRG